MAPKTFTPEVVTNGDSPAVAPTPASPEHRSNGGPVARELHGFVADLEDLVTATTSLTDADLARAKARLGERVTAAKETLVQTGSAVAASARRGATATDDYVQASPWRAVGIGAATGTVVGLLLGLLLARRP